jgi:hypothetical protein
MQGKWSLRPVGSRKWSPNMEAECSSETSISAYKLHRAIIQKITNRKIRAVTADQ